MEIDDGCYVLGKGDRAIPAELREVKDLRLRIWNSGFERFEELADYPNLVELDIMDYRSPSLAPLERLRRLRRLVIIHFPRVTSIGSMSRLETLEELTLETLPSWDASGKSQHLESLRPLAGLRRLRVLRLGGVRVDDNDLTPLGGLAALEELAIANVFPQQQFARLARMLPQVQCKFLAPFLPLGYQCTKCGGEKVMLSGSDVPNPKVVCPVCHRKKFEDTVARFENYKQG